MGEGFKKRAREREGGRHEGERGAREREGGRHEGERGAREPEGEWVGEGGREMEGGRASELRKGLQEGAGVCVCVCVRARARLEDAQVCRKPVHAFVEPAHTHNTHTKYTHSQPSLSVLPRPPHIYRQAHACARARACVRARGVGGGDKGRPAADPPDHIRVGPTRFESIGPQRPTAQGPAGTGPGTSSRRPIRPTRFGALPDRRIWRPIGQMKLAPDPIDAFWRPIRPTRFGALSDRLV